MAIEGNFAGLNVNWHTDGVVTDNLLKIDEIDIDESKEATVFRPTQQAQNERCNIAFSLTERAAHVQLLSNAKFCELHVTNSDSNQEEYCTSVTGTACSDGRYLLSFTVPVSRFCLTAA
jgi:hypothetical protein